MMAMDWTVNFYKDSKGKEPVKEFFLLLSDEGRAKALKLLGMVRTYGVLLKEPYTRRVKDKIRELRTNDKQGEIRILYFAYTGRTIVLLHGFVKKTQKTPLSEIEIAEKRLKDYIERYGGTK